MTKKELTELWNAWKLLYVAGCEPEWPLELDEADPAYECESVAREYVAMNLRAAHAVLHKLHYTAKWPALVEDQFKVYTEKEL